MKSVTHICQRQKSLGGRLSAFSRPILVAPEKTTLTCSRWSVGPKLRLKVLVDAGEKAS